jgi:hypothetical protein
MDERQLTCEYCELGRKPWLSGNGFWMHEGGVCCQTPETSERSTIRSAIYILDEKKKEVVHQDIEAWFTLFHAKQYLKGAQ